jgi:hypothetical protein
MNPRSTVTESAALEVGTTAGLLRPAPYAVSTCWILLKAGRIGIRAATRSTTVCVMNRLFANKLPPSGKKISAKC